MKMCGEATGKAETYINHKVFAALSHRVSQTFDINHKERSIKMKVCIIGCNGHIGHAYSEICDLPEVEFCGIAPGTLEKDASGAALECIPDFYREKMPCYEAYTEMLEEVKPDMAIVSSVFGLNGRIIIECAKRKIDVFAEKPVAATLEELNTVQQAVEKHGIRFCAMHYLRYTPSFYRGKELVAAGAVGDIRMITAQKSYRYGVRPNWYQDEKLYPGTIPWVGIHALDWIYFFTERKFLSVKALQWGKPEMAALCQFELEEQCIANANIDFLRPGAAPTHGDDRVRIAGTKGMLEIWSDHLELINENGVQVEYPSSAPHLTELFVQDKPCITAKEIFMLTKVALLARESAASGKVLMIK